MRDGRRVILLPWPSRFLGYAVAQPFLPGYQSGSGGAFSFTLWLTLVFFETDFTDVQRVMEGACLAPCQRHMGKMGFDIECYSGWSSIAHS